MQDYLKIHENDNVVVALTSNTEIPASNMAILSVWPAKISMSETGSTPII